MSFPREHVAPIQRVPFPHGLFSVIRWRTDNERWSIGGATFDPQPCGPALIAPEQDQCEDSWTDENPAMSWDFEAWNLPDNWEDGFDPFTVYAPYQCSPVGQQIAEAQAAATRWLLGGEQMAAEQHVWGIFENDDPFDVAVVASWTAAIALLEAEAGTALAGQGVLHLSRENAVYALAEGALTVSNGRLQTKLGTPVVAGAGYAGESVSNGVVLTGQLGGYRSEVIDYSHQPGDLLDRKQNVLHGLASRDYVIGWDTCAYRGVKITTI